MLEPHCQIHYCVVSYMRLMRWGVIWNMICTFIDMSRSHLLPGARKIQSPCHFDSFDSFVVCIKCGLCLEDVCGAKKYVFISFIPHPHNIRQHILCIYAFKLSHYHTLIHSRFRTWKLGFHETSVMYIHPDVFARIWLWRIFYCRLCNGHKSYLSEHEGKKKQWAGGELMALSAVRVYTSNDRWAWKL